MKLWVVPVAVVICMVVLWIWSRNADKRGLAAWARGQGGELLEVRDVHEFDGSGMRPLQDDNVQEYLVKVKLENGTLKQGRVVLTSHLLRKTDIQWREDGEWD